MLWALGRKIVLWAGPRASGHMAIYSCGAVMQGHRVALGFLDVVLRCQHATKNGLSRRKSCQHSYQWW